MWQDGPSLGHIRDSRKMITEVEFQVSFDYCFLRDTTGGESIPVLVGREKYSKLMVAHVVP